MKTMVINTDSRATEKFKSYPSSVRKKMGALRQLVLETAEKIQGLEELEETLKWGEPSYLTKKGSTLRMDWKPKTPTQYALYFKCTSKLVETFRTLYADDLTFEGKRAIVFDLDESLPVPQLENCITAALTYHKVKHLDNLGIVIP